MATKKILKTMLALAVALPMSAGAQVDVNRDMYPDYSDKTNPDWSLMKPAGASKSNASRTGEATASQRPSYVNNAELKFFPPVFNQDGGSCGSASRICYMFTYELNAYRNLSGKSAENYYPSHFVWLLTNGNSGKNEFVTSIGVPSAATYGGQTYSQTFGNQDCSNEDFGWMQGYDKWFEAMHNRMLEPSNFPMDVGTEEGREAVKNWLWNHSGDTSFQAGGVCGIGVASSGGNYDGKITRTAANSEAQVVGKKFVKAWGTQVDHALTIVGYDDRIEFDLDGNGVAGEVEKDEVGAWIIANSWGEWWGNQGFIYCPYAYAGASFRSDGTFAENWWAPEIYKVRKDYRPLRTIKLEMEYSRRSEIKLSAGISADINATAPENTIEFEHFKYAGDGNYGNTNPAPEVPMLGRWADGKLHKEPMEFGYDLTDLTAGYDRSMPLKYFFIIETRGWGKGSGKIHNASIMDYEHHADGLETPFNIGEGVEIKSAGNKTIISVVVYGEEYYAPQNFSLSGRTLSWIAPVRSGKSIDRFRIYNNDTKIAELEPAVTKYNIPQDVELEGTFSIAAVYADGVESQKVTLQAPIEEDAVNTVINLMQSGMKLPGVFNNKFENMTLEFYMKPNSLANWNQSAGPGWGTFMMHANADGSYTVGWDTNNRVTTATGLLSVGKWTHVAIVCKGKNIAVYINGARKGAFTSQSYNGIGGFGDFIFSAGNASTAQDASYDEIRLWNKVRTPKEIQNSMKAQFAGELLPDGLVAYYRGNTITVDGQTKIREYVNNSHAEILNNNYKIEESSIAMGKTKATISASINAVDGEVRACIPVTFSAAYSDAVTKLTWTIKGAGIENLAIKEPTATFTAAGEHEVIVTAEDFNGNTVTDTLVVNVTEEPEADATFKASKEPVVKGEKVTFIVEKPQIGYIYEWTIPGTDADEKVYGLHASAVYNTTGKQNVTLKVTSLSGSKSATSSIVVEVLDSKPEAAFEISPAIIIKGEKTFLKDISAYRPTEWEWTIENSDKKYIVNGQNSSLSPGVSGIYSVTLKASNEIGSSTATRERALIVCNADSRNGLSFSGRDNATVTASLSLPQSDVLTFEWWMRPDALTASCLGIGESESTFLLKTDASGTMTVSAGGASGKSEPNLVIANEWHHYAVVFEKTDYGCFAEFHRDGEYFSTAFIASNAGIPALSTFSIGNSSASMSGQIDEFRIWKKMVHYEELLAVCNAPLENPEGMSDLALYYDFNQSGGDVIDRSSNGSNGVRSGFGPDGDAWGLSRGVFCLNTDTDIENGDVTEKYLSNYYSAFNHDASTMVNTSIANRFYKLAEWTIENAVVNGSVTTGAHVDASKSYCMTFTTTWDGFSSSLNNHKVYQTVTLPAGNYKFTASYHTTWEGQCDNSYVIADLGTGLPNTAKLDDAIAYKKMAAKGNAMDNSIEFTLEQESNVSLGLLVNMTGQACMAIDRFSLERDNVEYIEADGETATSIESIVENENWNGDDSIYDLHGRKVLETQKGNIYIIKGKKVLVK